MNVETRLQLTETQWHDAQLCRLSCFLGDDTAADVVLELQLYATPDARDRHVRAWRFLNVHDLVLSANGPELQSHHDAGNVIQARLFESDGVDLNVFLCGAYLRVTADGLEDTVEASPFGGAENRSHDGSESSAVARPSKAMAAADAEVVLDLAGTDNPWTDDWFDGRLKSLTFITSDEVTDVVLNLELPKPMAPAEREARSYRFLDVKDITIALNSAELRRRRVKAGHITQGRMNYGRIDDEHDGMIPFNEIAPLDLSVYTTGGYIRIAAKTVEPFGI
jgi:hypothetical protein